MSTWSQFNPVQIFFGRGCRENLGHSIDGKRILIVCSPRGRKQFESDSLLSSATSKADFVSWLDLVEPNPTLENLQVTMDALGDAEVDFVVGFGGGSAIDSAKVLALALSPRVRFTQLRDMVEKCNKLHVGEALPLIAIPTTAGTGSEVTPYATIWDSENRTKLSLAGQVIYPNTALVDPQLIDNLPHDSTINSGLDAINQAIESIWNRNMTPMSEMMAQKALKLGFSALPILSSNPDDKLARDSMQECSLFAGLAISQTRTALCHSISYPLTACFGVPHGLACAFTMPAVLRCSLALDDGRFERLAEILCGDELNPRLSLITLFEKLNTKLRVSEKVRKHIGSFDDLLGLRRQMLDPQRSKNMVFDINPDLLLSILDRSWRL
jgi:phosphonate metabolism-associated iron-containing alcohol dehydrogenase